jgi:hypothetical protein
MQSPRCTLQVTLALPGGESLPACCAPHASVKDLKRFVKEQKGIARGKQCLKLGDRVLEDPALIKDVLVSNATVTVEVVRRSAKQSNTQPSGSGTATQDTQIKVGNSMHGMHLEDLIWQQGCGAMGQPGHLVSAHCIRLIMLYPSLLAGPSGPAHWQN